MFRVFNCLTVEHDWRLVLLAVLICFLTSLAAINLFHRARAASGRVQLAWLATAGITTGCGIWAPCSLTSPAFRLPTMSA